MSVENIEATKFTAEIRQIKSMADHTFNLVLNVPEYCLEQVQEIMGNLGDMVMVAMVVMDKDEISDMNCLESVK